MSRPMMLLAMRVASHFASFRGRKGAHACAPVDPRAVSAGTSTRQQVRSGNAATGGSTPMACGFVPPGLRVRRSGFAVGRACRGHGAGTVPVTVGLVRKPDLDLSLGGLDRVGAVDEVLLHGEAPVAPEIAADRARGGDGRVGGPGQRPEAL